MMTIPALPWNRTVSPVPTPDVDLPVEAVEAAARAAFTYSCPDYEWESETLEAILRWREQARAVLAAAMPHLRAQIADEILSEKVKFGRHVDLYNRAIEAAARLARGGCGVKIYFEPRDIWVGYFRGTTHHYVCPLPTLVIRWRRRDRWTRGDPVVTSDLSSVDRLNEIRKREYPPYVALDVGWLLEHIEELQAAAEQEQDLRPPPEGLS